jgi:ATP-dependent DNA helicase RecQ
LELLRVDYENFSALKLTESSRSVLKGERQILLRKYKKAEKAVKHKRQSAKDFAETQLDGLEQQIFERLRWWRVETAKAHNTAAYIIFHDSTLREIAKAQPNTLAELSGVSGVGAKKLESYGAQIMELLSEVRGQVA